MADSKLPALPPPTSTQIQGDQWNRAAVEAAVASAYEAGRLAGLEEAKRICIVQAAEPECPERAKYCAEAIDAAMKAKP